MNSEYKDFPPVFYLFFVPAVVGTIFWVLGIPFIMLGLIYWRSVSPVIRKIAVACAVLFILLDVPFFFGAGMAAMAFAILQTATVFIFALVAFFINRVRRHNTAVNSDAKRPLP